MRAILHFFIIIAFLAGIIAPACGFLWGGNFSVIEICTAQGIESRIVADTGDSNNTPAHKTSDKCQFCFSHANLVADIAPDFTLETVHFQVEKLKFQAYERLVFARINPQAAARAPPFFI